MAGKSDKEKAKRKAGRAWLLARSVSFFLCAFFLNGCAWDSWQIWKTPTPPPEGASDSMVLRGGKLVPETPTVAPNSAELAGAHELFRRGEFSQAEALFNTIAENKKNPPALAEEARFYEAECLRSQQKYPSSCDTYHKVMIDFPNGAYREQCCQRMFEIANYWLEDTRAEMRQHEEGKKGSWYEGFTPACHWEKSKPFLDEEGRAYEALEHVRLNDMTGPLADKCLFLMGSIQFYRENYAEADRNFTQLTEMHPNSPLCEQAVELAIISKHQSTGGSDYDGRKVAEARQLINKALANYPKLANEKQDFLMRQLVSCNLQQADKDWKIAEFYRRTGHPGSAYFYYEIVRRRYPGTKYFDDATQRMHELRAAVEKEQKELQEKGPKLPPPPKPGQSQPETAPQPTPVSPGGQPEIAPRPRSLPGNQLPTGPGS